MISLLVMLATMTFFCKIVLQFSSIRCKKAIKYQPLNWSSCSVLLELVCKNSLKMAGFMTCPLKRSNFNFSTEDREFPYLNLECKMKLNIALCNKKLTHFVVSLQ